MKVPLAKIAHTRSGDKGDTANIGVIVYDAKHYPVTHTEAAMHGEATMAPVERMAAEAAAATEAAMIPEVAMAPDEHGAAITTEKPDGVIQSAPVNQGLCNSPAGTTATATW